LAAELNVSRNGANQIVTTGAIAQVRIARRVLQPATAKTGEQRGAVVFDERLAASHNAELGAATIIIDLTLLGEIGAALVVIPVVLLFLLFLLLLRLCDLADLAESAGYEPGDGRAECLAARASGGQGFRDAIEPFSIHGATPFSQGFRESSRQCPLFSA
jgi:hypothetical protein